MHLGQNKERSEVATLMTDKDFSLLFKHALYGRLQFQFEVFNTNSKLKQGSVCKWENKCTAQNAKETLPRYIQSAPGLRSQAEILPFGWLHAWRPEIKCYERSPPQGCRWEIKLHPFSKNTLFSVISYPVIWQKDTPQMYKNSCIFIRC